MFWSRFPHVRSELSKSCLGGLASVEVRDARIDLLENMRRAATRLGRRDYESEENDVPVGRIEWFTLRVPLSETWLKSNASIAEDRDQRDPYHERLYFRDFGHRLPTALRSGPLLIDLLLDFSQRLSGPRYRLLRMHPGRIVSEANAAPRFCNPLLIRHRLRRLCKQVKYSPVPKEILPIFVQVSLLNIHPLRDGNGRFARLAHNACFAELTGYRGYLPLIDAIRESAGAFEIAVRQLELHQNWIPIIEFYTRFYSLLASDPGRRVVETAA